MRLFCEIGMTTLRYCCVNTKVSDIVDTAKYGIPNLFAFRKYILYSTFNEDSLLYLSIYDNQS